MADANARFEIKFNTARITGAVVGAWREANQLLGTQFTKKISQNIWQWPNETKRKKGTTAGTVRDIVDLGQLRSSYKRQFIGRDIVEHRWETEYAMAVHEGAVIENAWGRGIRVVLPARPWIRVTLREYDLASVYATIAKRYLGQIGGDGS